MQREVAVDEAAAQARLAAREQATRRDAERARHLERELFARSVGPVHRLRDRQLAELDLPRPLPHPRQREADERAALAESLSDEVNIESLLLTDDGLSFRRPTKSLVDRTAARMRELLLHPSVPVNARVDAAARCCAGAATTTANCGSTGLTSSTIRFGLILILKISMLLMRMTTVFESVESSLL